MARIDYFHDPDAPTPNSLIPAASAVVIDDQDRVLLGHRTDSPRWTIPGGAMEPGETIGDCAVRETREETGIIIEIDRLVGVYSDPRHIAAYSDGEVRQQFSVCFAGRPVGGQLATSSETREVAWVTLGELDRLEIHPSIRLRIDHALAAAAPYWT